MKRQSPHNALFLSVFSRKEEAIDELRAILPPAIVERIDWDTLTLVDGSFIDPRLSHRQSDLLYTVRLHSAEEIGIYILWEHQSTGDPLMPYRIWTYIGRATERWMSSHKESTRIPLILPVVVSHAKGGWKVAESLIDILMIPKELRELVRDYVPNFRFIHDDLTKNTDKQLMGRSMRALGVLALLLLKHGRSEGSLIPRLREWVGLLKEVWHAEDREEAFAILMRYVLLANRHTTVQELKDEVVPMLGDPAGEVVMTEVQRMMEAVRAEARVQLRAERKAREAEREARICAEREAREAREAEREARICAEREARIGSVLAIIDARGLTLSETMRERIQTCTDSRTLDRWLRRVATASSVEDAIVGE